MLDNIYDPVILENLKNISAYYKNLSTLSYDDIVNKLDGVTSLQINFEEQYDLLEDRQYSVVIIWDDIKDTRYEYLTVDQDPKDVYKNMIIALRKKMDPIFQITDQRGKYALEHPDLICEVNNNMIIFPRSIVDDVLACAVEFSSGEPDDVSCYINDEMVYIPSSLSSEVIEKRKKHEIK